MQKPTIGRIVHLSWNGARVPAAITFIHSDVIVDLQPLDENVPKQHQVWLEVESPESAASPNHMRTPDRSWSWPPRA